jgi:hypothetical protein
MLDTVWGTTGPHSLMTTGDYKGGRVQPDLNPSNHDRVRLLPCSVRALPCHSEPHCQVGRRDRAAPSPVPARRRPRSAAAPSARALTTSPSRSPHPPPSAVRFEFVLLGGHPASHARLCSCRHVSSPVPTALSWAPRPRSTTTPPLPSTDDADGVPQPPPALALLCVPSKPPPDAVPLAYRPVVASVVAPLGGVLQHGPVSPAVAWVSSPAAVRVSASERESTPASSIRDRCAPASPA